MFQTMGAGQSTASKVPPRALHVLRVTPSSPAPQTNIEPYFDFLVGFKDENLAANNIDASELERIVENHEGRPLDLLVWNSKSQSVRSELGDTSADFHRTEAFSQLCLSCLHDSGRCPMPLMTPKNPNRNANLRCWV